MNGLSLRISTGAKKSKNIMSLPPVVITNFPADNAPIENELVKTFLQAATADEQLGILKQMLDKEAGPADLNIMKFLVVVFFYSEAKHPVKCFITRHVTKSNHLQSPFINLLSSEIAMHLKDYNVNYETYKDTVPKIGMCLENFPAGTCAVEKVKELLALYLASCLYSCIDTVRTEYLSPMKKNEIYCLAHLTLRLLLHIITKNEQILKSIPDEKESVDDMNVPLRLIYHCNIRESIDVLLQDKDVPMDTKSVCGLVALSLYTHSCNNDDALENFMYSKENAAMTDEVQLAMYSAIITTVPMQRLQENHSLEKTAPIVIIVKTFMDIVERCSSDCVLILGVTRSLLQVSKGLFELKIELGVQMTEQLLSFVWIHLEHYMDSVRHLTAQILASAVHYCAALEFNGRESGLARALALLAALGVRRRGFHAGVRGVARALPAGRVLRDVAPLPRLLPALSTPHVASATAATLDDLLVRHSRETETSVIHERWVMPIIRFVQANDLEPEVLTILENLLAKAVKLDQKLVTFILPYIKQACETPENDPKNVLLLLNVARASIAKAAGPATSNHELWGGVLPYEVLYEAVVDAREEVRLAALRLACLGGSAGGGAGGGELAAVLRYLEHAAHEAPHCLQRARPDLYKFIKRLFDGIRAASRDGDEERSATHRELMEQLRRACYCNLRRGSHARRATALQLLRAIEPGPLPYQRSWKQDYVEMLLVHLEDSYETNKALALEILQHVPVELLKKASSVSLQLDDIISQAAALRPTESASAAYKLELLWRRLPDHILQGKPCGAAEPALWALGSALAARLPRGGRRHVLRAPRPAPAFGLLHGLARLLDACLDPDAIANCREWQQLIGTIIVSCRCLIDETGAVVNHASPEGVMPQDCQYSDYGNNSGVRLEDGQLVTAQMVLLCAWRTHKEATSVLGSIGARCRVDTVGAERLLELAETLSRALATARHRGAFEQAYVAYERVLHRMWRCEDARVQHWPARQLAQTLAWPRAPRLADRRSAGMPFLVQALVSTELGAGGPGTCLRDVMTELLRRAGAEAEAGAEAGAEAEAAANHRAHACNVLRALYRDSSLEAAVRGYVGEGLLVALKGFEGATWVERNSSTLLLSALMTRVFGVARARAGLSARNRMTGRLFFLRYPRLYDIMLNKLKEVSESEEKLLLCPSLYPVLLLLARLYPSSLEGTESNLKLVSFTPLVVACARARALLTRRLAAAAGVALVAPDRYVKHLQDLLGLVSEPRIERNFCHGILLQICALLENKPSDVECAELAHAVPGSLWLLEQACFPLLHQHALLLTTLLTRFPETLRRVTLDAIEARLRAALFGPGGSAAAPACGRELALAACLRLLLRLAPADVPDLVLRALQHDVHEVCSAALDYLLGLYGRGRGREEGDGEGEKRGEAEAEAVLSALRLRAAYLPLLAAPLQQLDTWRCDPQRSLKHLEVLVAEGGTQELVTNVVPVNHRTDDRIVDRLRRLIDRAADDKTHLFLESLTSYVSPRASQPASPPALSLHELVQAGAAVRGAGRPPAARLPAARALRRLAPALLQRARAHPDERTLFRLECVVFASVAQLLLCEEPEVRAEAAAAALHLAGETRAGAGAVAPRAAALLLRACARRPRAVQLLTALALSADPADPYDPDDPDDAGADECRVFSRRAVGGAGEVGAAGGGERARWAAACAGEVAALCAREGVAPLAHVARLLDEWSFEVIDTDSADAFRALAAGGSAAPNPIVELFVRTLKGEI